MYLRLEEAANGECKFYIASGRGVGVIEMNKDVHPWFKIRGMNTN